MNVDGRFVDSVVLSDTDLKKMWLASLSGSEFSLRRGLALQRRKQNPHESQCFRSVFWTTPSGGRIRSGRGGHSF